MSETFGLTGVDVEQSAPQKVEQQQTPQQQKEPIKKIVVSSGPKKEEHILKSNTRLPPIEDKKGAQTNQSTWKAPSGTGQGTTQNQAGNNQQKDQQILSKGVRAISSKSMINVRRIDTLKMYLDTERAGNKEEKNKKKPDGVSKYGRRLELEKEKKEKKVAFVEGYKKKIENDYNQLYRQDDYDVVIKQLKQLEGKVKLQGEIKRNEEMLNKDQKEFNMLRYQIDSKQKFLSSLRTQSANLYHAFTTKEDQELFAKQEILLEKNEQQLGDENVVQMSLKNMMENRKELLLFEKKKSEEMYSEYVKLKNELHGFEEDQISNQQKHKDQGRQLSLYQSKNIFGLNVKFQELLEDELSEYEDKNALHEIFRHEQSRKDDQVRKEKEAKKIELEQLQFEKQKQQDKIKQEQRQVEQILNQKRKNMEELLKISCVSDISELEERKLFLEDSNLNLKKFEMEFQESIDSQKREIIQLRAQLNQLKYIQKEIKQSDQKLQDLQESSATPQNKSIQVIDEVNLTANVNIDKFEQMLIEETDKMQDKENHVKKLERVVDEICLVFSRILYQLQPPNQKQKNIEVKRSDLRNQITICGLKLEKIISFLAKKKDSLRIESINTDADNFQPPEYVGINPKCYVRQRDIDDQNVYEETKEFKFDYKEDDPDEFEADKFLLKQRSKVHRGSIKEESENENSF